MADGRSTNVAKMARLLAVAHIVIGILLVCFGIADRLVRYEYKYEYDRYDVEVEVWTGYGYFGVWIGAWMCITGGLGIPGSGRVRTASRNAFAGVFMGFSITSAVFGGIIIVCYSIMIAIMTTDYDHDYHNYISYDNRYDTKLAILAVMLILGIATFVVGIWAPICCCLLKPCCTPQQYQGQQMMSTGNPPPGYVTTEVSGGYPVAVPVQTGAGGVVAQGVQPPMVLVSASSASGTQPVIVQSAPTAAMATGSPSQQVQPEFEQMKPPYTVLTSDSQPQEAEMPHSFGRRGYMPLQNEEMD